MASRTDQCRTAHRPPAWLLAQEVAPVLPELVQTSDDTLALNYDGVTPVLVEAVKELSQKFEARLAEKDAQIQALQARLTKIEAAVAALAQP